MPTEDYEIFICCGCGCDWVVDDHNTIIIQWFNQTTSHWRNLCVECSQEQEKQNNGYQIIKI